MGEWRSGYEHGEGVLLNTSTQQQFEGTFLYGQYFSRDDSSPLDTKKKKEEGKKKQAEEGDEGEEEEEDETSDVKTSSRARKTLFFQSFLVYPIHLCPFFWESSRH